MILESSNFSLFSNQTSRSSYSFYSTMDHNVWAPIEGPVQMYKFQTSNHASSNGQQCYQKESNSSNIDKLISQVSSLTESVTELSSRVTSLNERISAMETVDLDTIKQERHTHFSLTQNVFQSVSPFDVIEIPDDEDSISNSVLDTPCPTSNNTEAGGFRLFEDIISFAQTSQNSSFVQTSQNSPGLYSLISEKKQQHNWTCYQRKFICILKRFYRNDMKDITELFNESFRDEITRSKIGEVRKEVIITQWSDLQRRWKENQRLDPDWVEVYLAPFENPSVRWRELHQKILETAQNLKIVLLPRQFEDDRQCPKRGRRRLGYFRNTRRNTGQGTVYIGRNEITCLPQTPVVQTPVIEQSTVQRVVEEPSSDILQPKNRHDIPVLVYRCYDDISAGINSPTLFRAHRFAGISRWEITPPPEEGSLEFQYDVANHLWIHAGGSPLISTTDSFLMVFLKAYQSLRAGRMPRISIIQTSKLPWVRCANRIIRTIRARGELRQMYYKGVAEYFVWGEIRSDAIMKDISFTDIQRLAVSVPGVHNIMRLDMIFREVSVASPGSNESKIMTSLMRPLRAKFFEIPIAINSDTAEYIARVVAKLGFTSSSPPEFIQQIVMQICQGWVISPQNLDYLDLQHASKLFAQRLQEESGGGSTEPINLLEGAFSTAVHTALDCLEKEQELSRKAQRKRRR